jgi:acetyl esterase/lipase
MQFDREKLMTLNKLFLAASMLLAGTTPAPAQMPVPVAASAPAEPDAIPLDPAARATAPENWARFGTALAVRNVTRATLTPVLPDPAKTTGAAVIVAPGGAFMMLAMGHEGWNVAQWFADHGIAAFVLKYRPLPTPAEEGAAGNYMNTKMMDSLRDPAAPPTIKDPAATQDALSALRMVRAKSGQWHIDPTRVGMIGFSAGAMTAMNATLEGSAAERPAFVGYIYGPQNAVTVPENAPPLFAAIAMDDALFPNNGFGIVRAWHAAKRPVELHAYERGNHGFGMGLPGTTTTGVMDEFLLWLNSGGWLKRP